MHGNPAKVSGAVLPDPRRMTRSGIAKTRNCTGLQGRIVSLVASLAGGTSIGERRNF